MVYGHHSYHTLGDQIVDFFLSSLSALVYSAWARLAAGNKSPSDLLIITASATSIIPFFIPIN